MEKIDYLQKQSLLQNEMCYIKFGHYIKFDDHVQFM